jgi:hypothetical protein
LELRTRSPSLAPGGQCIGRDTCAVFPLRPEGRLGGRTCNLPPPLRWKKYWPARRSASTLPGWVAIPSGPYLDRWPLASYCCLALCPLASYCCLALRPLASYCFLALRPLASYCSSASRPLASYCSSLLEARSSKLEARSSQFEARSSKLAARSSKLAARSLKLAKKTALGSAPARVALRLSNFAGLCPSGGLHVVGLLRRRSAEDLAGDTRSQCADVASWG